MITPSISTNQDSPFALSTNQNEVPQRVSNLPTSNPSVTSISSLPILDQNVDSLINAAQSLANTTPNQLTNFVLPGNSRTLNQQDIPSITSNLQLVHNSNQKLTLAVNRNQTLILPKVGSNFNVSSSSVPSNILNTEASIPITTEHQKIPLALNQNTTLMLNQDEPNLDVKNINQQNTPSNARLILQSAPIVKMETQNLQDNLTNDSETLTLNGTLVVPQNSDLNINQNQSSSMGINLTQIADSGEGTINIQVLDSSINYAISQT